MTPSVAEVEAFHEFLADHFIMWRDLEPPGPPGEWFCSCGLKFGFSDSAIHHVASLLAAREAAARAEGARAVVEAVESLLDEAEVGWTLPRDVTFSLRQVARNAARTDGAGS